MKGFEQYDLQGWLENGLSFHPEVSKPAPDRVRRVRGYITRLAVPLIAMAAFGTAGATVATYDASSVAQGQLVIAAQSPSIILKTSVALFPSALAIADFEAHAQALLAEVCAGDFTNVPTETLVLAAEA